VTVSFQTFAYLLEHNCLHDYNCLYFYSAIVSEAERKLQIHKKKFNILFIIFCTYHKPQTTQKFKQDFALCQ